MSAPSVVFLHRSVGRNLIQDGKLYELVSSASRPFALNDFDQNTHILQTDQSKQYVAWHIPGNDTGPANYAELFSLTAQSNNDPTLATILAYDIIVLKSCYTSNNLKTSQDLEQAQAAYQKIAQFFRAYPGKKVVILTSPPLTPWHTNPEAAARARALADWLAHANLASNITVFDLFNELATPVGQHGANTLRKQFRRWLPFDSHPNATASQVIAPKLIKYLTNISSTNLRQNGSHASQ